MIKYIILILAVLSNTMAQLSLRFTMREQTINSKTNFSELFKSVITDKYVWLGLICYGLGFSLYLYILSKFEVSFIYPLITGSIFVFLLTFSALFLQEPLTIKKISGIGLIILGIIIAS